MFNVLNTPANYTMQSTHQQSTLYTLLPSALQVSLPHLLSLRHPFSALGISSKFKNSGKKRASHSGIITPEEKYNSVLYRSLHNKSEVTGYCSKTGEYNEEYNEVSHRNLIEVDIPTTRIGGIDWKFAHQGLSLLNLALSENSTTTLNNVPFIRQLYIHSLTYLIRALPPDLSSDEQVSIQAALPEGIVDTHDHQHHPLRSEVRPTSVLHRTLASTIVQLFVLFQFILPYIRFLLAKAWAYEKEHQIIVRITSKCIELSMGIGEAMKGMGEGKLGEILTGIVQWIIEGIIGGIGEGMFIIGGLGRNDVGGLVVTQVGRVAK